MRGTVSVLAEPVAPDALRRIIREALATGTVSFSRHACGELEKDRKTTGDAINVLRGGVVRAGERENGSWRYRVETARLVVVIAVRSQSSIVVVTAWKVTS